MRILRTLSRLMRLAVRLATQPFSNRIRTLAMSSPRLRTAMPTASTLMTGTLN
jgi:hypothetical protein